MIRHDLKAYAFRSRRLIAGWFGIFALTLPLLAPIAQGIPTGKNPDAGNAPFYMVMCKAMLDGSDHPSEQKPDMTDCPVCLSFAFGNSVFSAPIGENPAPIHLAAAFNPIAHDQTYRSLPQSRSHARAPPSFG